jgi:hypothetical protein
MSIQVAIGHLSALEERRKKPSGETKEGRLILTEEEWMVRLKFQEGEGSGGNHSGRGRGRGKRPDGRGGDGDGDRGSPSDSNEETSRHS